MLGTIDELEKEIEQFKNNVMASGELIASLDKVYEQIKNQNDSFDEQSKKLLSSIESVPSSIEKSNADFNQNIQKDVSAEISRAIKEFSDYQEKYIRELEQVKQQLSDYTDQIGKYDKNITERSAELIEKFDSTWEKTKKENTKLSDSLSESYEGFIDTLKKMNISNLYEQNQQLKNELNKKTILLVVMSVIGIVIGVLGIVL